MQVWRHGRYTLEVMEDGPSRPGDRFANFWFAFCRDGRALFSDYIGFPRTDRPGIEQVTQRILWMVTLHPDNPGFRPRFETYTAEQLAWACSGDAAALRRCVRWR